MTKVTQAQPEGVTDVTTEGDGSGDAPSVTRAPSTPPPPETLGPARAWVLAWTFGALVNFAFIAALAWPKAGLRTRLLHHTFDLGHMLFLGLVAAGIATLWRRFGPARPIWALVALEIGAVAAGLVLLPEDLENFSRNFPGPPWLVMAALVTSAMTAIPAAVVAGGLLARRGLRPIAVAIGLAVFVVNNVVLSGDYPGGHFLFAWAAASLVASALTDAPPHRRLLRAAEGRRSAVLLAAATALAGTTVLMRPPQSVGVQLGLVDGSILAPQLGRIRELFTEDIAVADSDIPPAWREWFVDRDDHPPIPASEPRILPDDAIVVVVSIDSMRAELLEDEQYRSRLPRLWQLADRSVRFTLARAPGSSTRAVFGSVLTGKHRSQLDWAHSKRLQWHLKEDDTPQLPELLRDADIASLHSVSFKYLLHKYHVVKGFDEEVFVPKAEGQRFALAEAVMEPLLARLREGPEGRLFMWAHLMDGHDPYDAVTEEGTDYERHIAELGLCDAQIGALWDLAEDKGLLDRLVVVITADHGEGFGKHNTPHHYTTLYEELVRVPLLVRVPGVEPRVVADPVSLLDLGPTLLDLLGLPTPGYHMGQSLVPYLRGESPALTRPIGGATVVGRKPIYFLMLEDGSKVIWNRKASTREVYVLADDPDEELNVYDDLGEEGARRFALLRRFFEGHDHFGEQNEGVNKKPKKKPRKKKKKKKKTKKKASKAAAPVEDAGTGEPASDASSGSDDADDADAPP
jgi:hypothetical protein